MTKAIVWTVCGRRIGTATGWDQYDLFLFQLYNFIPYEGCLLPKGDICINFETGTVELYAADGTVIHRVDLIESIKELRG